MINHGISKSIAHRCIRCQNSRHNNYWDYKYTVHIWILRIVLSFSLRIRDNITRWYNNWDPFYNHLTIIPVLISNGKHYKVWDDVTSPFPNFNGCTVDVCEWIRYLITHITAHVITYPCLYNAMLVKKATDTAHSKQLWSTNATIQFVFISLVKLTTDHLIRNNTAVISTRGCASGKKQPRSITYARCNKHISTVGNLFFRCGCNVGVDSLSHFYYIKHGYFGDAEVKSWRNKIYCKYLKISHINVNN